MVSSRGLGDVYKRQVGQATKMLGQMGEIMGTGGSPVQKGIDSLDRGVQAIESLAKPTQWLMDHKKEVGLGALGVGSAVGGFMLLRDYLNRKREKEKETAAGVPKVAA